MHNTKGPLSLLWIFALLNYLYADVVALFAIAGTGSSFEPLSPLALLGAAVLMEIPIAMILACRLFPFRANRLANIVAGAILTLINAFLTFVPPLAGWGRPPAFPEYVFFATTSKESRDFGGASVRKLRRKIELHQTCCFTASNCGSGEVLWVVGIEMEVGKQQRLATRLRAPALRFHGDEHGIELRDRLRIIEL